MCGIVSVFRIGEPENKKPSVTMEKLFKDLLWIDTIRGVHSTGLLWKHCNEDSADMYKKVVPGWDFVQMDMPKKIIDGLHLMPFMIGHNRAATKGDVNVNNAHPFQFGDISGVHNGTLQNHYQLSPRGASHQVDSQHLYHAISEYGFDEVVNKVKGSFALLWHDNSDDTIHMCKNDDRPYTFAKIKDHDYLIGASEKPMLKWLIKRYGYDIEYCWSPKDNKEYIWKIEGNSMKYDRGIQHEGYTAPVVNTVTYLPKKNGASHSTIGNDSGAELVEFFLDSYVLNSSLVHGKKSCTMYGETTEGEEVCVFCVTDDDELNLDTWYRGRGMLVRTVATMNDYLRVFKDSIKLHPIELANSALQVCSNCGVDHSEDDGVFIDNVPVCLDCCNSLGVKAEQVDNDESWKLFIQPRHYH